jgi:hypothetical protein
VTESGKEADGSARCMICGATVGESDDWHFRTPVVSFSDLSASPHADDLVFHANCYTAWPQRADFARVLFEHRRGECGANPYWVEISHDARHSLQANPRPPVAELALLLAATGRDIRIKIRSWERWLEGPVSDDLLAVETEQVRALAPELAEKFPTRAHVLDAAKGDSQSIA